MWRATKLFWHSLVDSRLSTLDDTQSVTCFQRSPLHIAVLSNDVNFASKIIFKYPHLCLVTDTLGWTPLALASSKSSVEMVELLITRPNACLVRDHHRLTPLHLAVLNNRVDVIDVLLEKGLPSALLIESPTLDPVAPAVSNVNESILHFALRNNVSVETLNILVDKIRLARDTEEHDPPRLINTNNGNGFSVLQVAANAAAVESGKVENLHFLLESSQLKGEITIALRDEAINLLPVQVRNELNTKFVKRSCAVSTKADAVEKEWKRESLSIILLITTLILGIAYGAAMNPPGGYWQDDSKVSLETDPLAFAMYFHARSESDRTSFDNYISEVQDKNSRELLKSIVIAAENDYGRVSLRAFKGLVLEDWFHDLTSRYINKTGNSTVFYPYIIRYAGTPVMAYIHPAAYLIYMTFNGLAMILSMSIIVLALAGVMIEPSHRHVRILSMMTVLVVLFIAGGFVVAVLTLTPGHYILFERGFRIILLEGLLVCGGLTGTFIISLVNKVTKLEKRKRHHHIRVIDHLAMVVCAIDAGGAAKILFFLVVWLSTVLLALVHWNYFVFV